MELAGRATPPPETVRPPVDWSELAWTLWRSVEVPVEPETVSEPEKAPLVPEIPPFQVDVPVSPKEVA